MTFNFICRDYTKLIDCLCRIAAMEKNMPDDAQPLWKQLKEVIVKIDKATVALSKALDIAYQSHQGDFCDNLKQLFNQLKRICKAAAKLTDEEASKLSKQFEDFEALLKSLLDLFAQLKAVHEEHKVFPCDDDGEPPSSRYVKLQSKYLYLQAAGSEGTDGTAKGMHLRWAFRNDLAKQHLPKGNLSESGPYATSTGHNRPDDFVYLYRMGYDRSKAPEIDFRKPPHAIVLSNRREWQYNIVGFSGNVKVFVRFLDSDQYDNIGLDPNVKPHEFIKSYPGIIEIEFEDSLMFGAEFNFQALPKGCFSKGQRNPGGAFLVEAISAEHGDPGAHLSLACRKKLFCDTTLGCTEHIVCENVRYFRVKQDRVSLTVIKLEAYQDVYRSKETQTLLGKFSLTEDDSLAFKRLEDQSKFTIDKSWPQYNDGTTVRTDNYKDKWIKPEGIKAAQEKYLTLSKTDVLATEILPSENPGDTSQIPVSYLSILNLIASDFHFARMLGLGHIDVPEVEPADGFIYLALYQGKHKLVYQDQAIKADYIGLAYMSLPTKHKDNRLPLTPELRAVKYGLNIPGPGSAALFDEEGYSKFYDVRFVNIGREKYNYEVPFQSFFQTASEFCTCQLTEAILYGVEYKKQNEIKYRKPEITSLVGSSSSENYLAWDTDHTDGVRETIPVPDNEESLFVHSETEEGIHCYAIYGINWFSRASAASSSICTDKTEFPKKNTLIPPSNLAVQYIQKEDTLVFTSQEEQNMLAAREAASPGGDNNFTRVSFEYNHNHHIAYQRGNKLNFYFRESLPLEVKGKVSFEQNYNGSDLLSLVTVTSYASLETGNLIEPQIPSGLFSRFIGGIFTTESEQFLVSDIMAASPYPKIVVERLVKREVIADTVIDPETGESITSYQNAGGSPVRPIMDEKFSLIENLSNEAQWKKLNKQVDIIHFSSHTETEIQEGGQEIILNVEGIFAKASIIPSTSIAGINGIEGVSKVSFQTATLANHPDSDVSWYKGTARLATASGEIKAVEVMRIETQNPLVIWIYDSEFAGIDAIATGNNLDVNFHPGYKVYLDPEPVNTFDRTHIIPTSGHNKKTLIGTQSVNTTNVPEHRSPVSIPAVLLAQRIVIPVPPGIPIGPTFSTRPDFYGKSSYTFDVEVNTLGGRTPFSFIFFRGDDAAVLNALYKNDTLSEIEETLKSLSTNVFQVNRFSDLVNVVFDTDLSHGGEFRLYDGYRLPEPDKTGLLTGNESLVEKQTKIRNAVNSVFVPLTQNPPLFDFVKNGRVTESTPPKIKDSNGDLLDQSSPDFNPFPMVKKFTDGGKTYVRFTDFTLDGTSVNMYFYHAIELSNQLVMSERSPICGPVMLVNSFPPEAPAIKTVIPQTANPVEEKIPMVFFQIEPYLGNENIEKVNIYRATNADMAGNVRTMALAASCELNLIADEFKDLPLPPFGEILYYRLVALRKIKNEQNNDELIPSKASELFITNIIDVINPEAPALSYSYGLMDASHNLIDLTLAWEPTCYNGTYHLYKLSKKGNWEKIYSVKSNAPMSFPPGGDFVTYPQTKKLAKQNDEGKIIHHRFKVQVLNASGLINLKDKGLSI